MPDYRKKPVQIEARELTHSNIPEIMTWCGSSQYWSKPPMREVTGIIIPTLEGQHEASFGDMIIKGIAGEFYPCKPEIFQNSYEMIVTKEKLLEILSWDEDPEEEGYLPDRVTTHDGTWILDGDIYYFEPNKEN